MPEETGAALASWLPIVLMVVIFYLLLYRPQKKARQERDAMLGSLKVGSRIVTVGGIFGTIVSLSDDVVRLKIADNVEIEITRAAIGNLAEKN